MAEYGWIRTTVVHLRREPNDRAERVSQLPIFTAVEIIEEAQRGWVKVRGPDGYEGWVKNAQLQPGKLPSPTWKVRAPWVQVRLARGPGILGLLPLDARFLGREQGGRVWLRWPTGELGWVPKSAVLPVDWQGTIKALLRTARRLVGAPYLWGGTTPFGFDCSGFVQRLFHFVFNVWLPRDSRDQQRVGERIPRLPELQPGDLVCFPRHVALWLGNGEIVHASGRLGQVAVTDLSLDEPYSQELRNNFLFGVRINFRWSCTKENKRNPCPPSETLKNKG